MSLNYEVDLSLAIQLQAQFDEEVKTLHRNEIEVIQNLEKLPDRGKSRKQGLAYDEPDCEKLNVSLIDPCWEVLDPCPNIHDLFLIFNKQFFWGRLLGVEVKWSPRMTLCAGVCSYEGRGGLCSIRLSVPLLKLRPRKDLVETLLHEMIHAYLFVTCNNRDRDGHGPQFHSHMYRINNLAGTKITVYHTFHDEVSSYRQHVWQCDGPCRRRPPYFGLVKRSMNRAPSKTDYWWNTHQSSCGGQFIKIKSPDPPAKSSKHSDKASKKAIVQGKDIRSFFSPLKERNSLPIDDKANISNSKKNSATITGDRASNMKKVSSGELNSTGFKKNNRSIFTASNTKTITTTIQSKKRFRKDTETGSELKVSAGSNSNNSIVPFQGVGYKLGGNGVRSNFDSSSFSGRKTVVPIVDEKIKDNSLSLKSPSNLQSNSRPSKSSDFVANRGEIDEISSKSSDSMIVSSGNSSYKASNENKKSICNGSACTSVGSEFSVEANSEFFPCPVCQESFSCDIINQHAESHFV